ncbi:MULTISPECIES: hypothetical protein [Mycobacteriaceae]|uniref:Uncharacterized protein n=1 Tax=Mycolicibacterium senegalense TaxID=1796 RepID=A0ABR5FMR7_9MYCO|nr:MULTISPECIES: hypothetical protein [Mycolicibacterium]KLI09387.1 hypothetical protein AA982_04990 [Mycolicibacterium senegalense]KLO47779.1 hypothetical protein ABW05_32010 [Mycolicibacterium senegalense]OMB74237.1 hypothetical protein A5741_04600 [Mycolicibacterium conceptionense]
MPPFSPGDRVQFTPWPGGDLHTGTVDEVRDPRPRTDPRFPPGADEPHLLITDDFRGEQVLVAFKRPAETGELIMPRIRIDIRYNPDLAHYPGATTAAEAMQFDIDNVDVHELIEFAGGDVTATVVED